MATFSEGCCAKPDIIIDDMPSTVLNPFHFDINKDGGWESTVDKLLSKHVDRAVAVAGVQPPDHGIDGIVNAFVFL